METQTDSLQSKRENKSPEKDHRIKLLRNLPVSLIWGRHDRANNLEIAETASKQYGWPLHVIDEARDDPKLEQPEAFTEALFRVINAKPTQVNVNKKDH